MLCSLQEGLIDLEPSMGICGDYMGTFDVSKKVLGSNLEDEDFEE